MSNKSTSYVATEGTDSTKIETLAFESLKKEQILKPLISKSDYSDESDSTLGNTSLKIGLSIPYKILVKAKIING